MAKLIHNHNERVVLWAVCAYVLLNHSGTIICSRDLIEIIFQARYKYCFPKPHKIYTLCGEASCNVGNGNTSSRINE